MCKDFKVAYPMDTVDRARINGFLNFIFLITLLLHHSCTAKHILDPKSFGTHIAAVFTSYASKLIDECLFKVI